MCRCPCWMPPRLRWMHLQLQQQERQLLLLMSLHSSLMSCKWDRTPQVRALSEGHFGLPLHVELHSCGRRRHTHRKLHGQLTCTFMSTGISEKFQHSFWAVLQGQAVPGLEGVVHDEEEEDAMLTACCRVS